MKNHFGRLLIAGLLSASLPGFSQATDITIAHIGPLSGAFKKDEEDSLKVMRSYFDDVNKKGGVNGSKVKLVYRDDGYSAPKFAEMAKDLIDKEHPVAFIGGAGCGGVIEATRQKVFETAGIPIVGPICGSPAARQSPFIFHIRASWPEEMQKLVQQMQALGRQRIGVLYQNDVDGRMALGVAKSYVKQAGMEVVASGSFDKGTTRVEGAVKSIADQNPDTVMLLGPEFAVAEFAKQYRATGNNGQFYTMSFVSADDLVKAAGLEAVRGTGIGAALPFINTETIPLSKEFRAFAKKIGISPDYVRYEYYVASKVLHEGLKRAGKGVDGAKLITALESITDYSMGGYRLNFGPGNRFGSKFVEVTLIGPSGQLIK